MPEVRFSDGSCALLGYEEFSLESGGKIVARRKQIPLAGAWALSVHKSQVLQCKNVVSLRFSENGSLSLILCLIILVVERVVSGNDHQQAGAGHLQRV